AAGYKVYPAEKIRSNLPPQRTLIDLHADKLSQVPDNADPAVILDIQLNTFESFYEQAVLHNLSQITVIHGIGTGRLKEEIHELLRHKKEVKSFANRLHPLYGYGSTEIWLNQIK
ncbi:MAG: Smr/MutS family protein, partial [bacterium]